MFCDNLKILRKEKGLSQEELASRLHVVRQTVSKWEKGLSIPDADLLVRLSEILETPVGTLLGVTVEESPDSSVISQQLEQINASLSERNRRGRFIWRMIGIVLAAILVLTIAFIIVGVVSFDNYNTNTRTHVEEISSEQIE